MSSLAKACEKALKVCMGLKPNEKLLVVYDSKKSKIAKCFFKEGEKITKNVKLFKINEPRVNGEEPSKKAASEMLKYNVVMLVTSRSLSHTKARRNACAKGARIASMPDIREDTMKRAIYINYDKLAERGHKIKNILSKGDKVRIITSIGTDIIMSIKNRDVKGGKGGIIHEKGDWDNLPAGESCTTPVEGSSNGIFVVDASFSGVGKLKKPIKVTVKDGYAVKIEGSKEAEKLKKILDSIHDKNAYNIAELGIGTNDKAKIIGCVLEDEKVFGTAHIALGNSKSLGGKIDVPIHLDGVFSKPTIFVNNKKIMEKGKLII